MNATSTAAGSRDVDVEQELELVAAELEVLRAQLLDLCRRLRRVAVSTTC